MIKHAVSDQILRLFLPLSLVMDDVFCQLLSSERLFWKTHIKNHGLGCINCAVFSLHCKRFKKSRNSEGCIFLFLMFGFTSFNEDEHKFLD